jgi:hypothetical protein
MTKYKYFKSKNYRANVNLVVESDIVEVSDQTSDGGDFIPLSGTEVGSPVTGDIEIEDGDYEFRIKRGLGAFKREILWNDEGGMRIIVSNEDNENEQIIDPLQTVFVSEYPIKHFTDVSNVLLHDPLSYAQRAYVDSIIIDDATTAINNRKYTSIATLTVTDPTPVEGKGYIVFVRNGTTTIDGVGYTSGNLIYRFYQGGVWSSTVFGVSAPINTATQTALDKMETFIYSKSNDIFGSHTGTTAETVLLSIDIDANEFEAGDFMTILMINEKTTAIAGATLRIRAGTTGTTADALIVNNAMSATLATIVTERVRMQFLTGNLLRGVRVNVSQPTDVINVPSINTSLNPSSAWKLTFTVLLGDASDNVDLTGFRIGKIKTF